MAIRTFLYKMNISNPIISQTKSIFFPIKLPELWNSWVEPFTLVRSNESSTSSDERLKEKYYPIFGPRL